MCSSGESGLLPLQSSGLPGWIALQLLEERGVLGKTEVGTEFSRVSQHLKKEAQTAVGRRNS